MSLHSSLRTSGNLASKRSVLNRTERIAKLEATKGYDPEKKPVLGMPKTNAKGAGGH
ncbi:MAG: small basic protein [Phycisphaerales bacterium]